MKNRLPKYPGRVKLVPVAGQPNVYDTVRADEPTEAGTPLNKGTLLSDATASILELNDTAVPDDAFLRLAMGSKNYLWRIKVLLPDGTPFVGAVVSGLTTVYGSELVTSGAGTAVGASLTKSISLSITTAYSDLQTYSAAFAATDLITDVTIQMITVSGQQMVISASKSLTLSPAVKQFDVCLVGGGGGGGGGSGYLNYGGAGGGGGNTKNIMAIQHVSTNSYTVNIGSRGGYGSYSYTKGSNGYGGGTTEFAINSVVFDTAVGGGGGGGAIDNTPYYGLGGSGAGNGGNSGHNGKSGSPPEIYKFNDVALGYGGGGGGGGGAVGDADGPVGSVGVGGLPSGGGGGVDTSRGSDGSGFGGGGGGGGGAGSNNHGGLGGAGGAYIRWRYI